MVASQMNAQQLLLLTDIEGVYDADPRTAPDARLIPRIKRVDDSLLQAMGGGGLRGRGGMRSKLEGRPFGIPCWGANHHNQGQNSRRY